MEFQRAHHRAIARVLKSLDSDLLERAQCFFGGGTAIVLNCGEYRESVDIGFLCSSTKGYRDLTAAVWGNGLAGLLRPEQDRAADIREVRELRRSRDKMACMIGVQSEDAEVCIRFEIVKEARIQLAGGPDPVLCVPVLSTDVMYAEKLLANTDRGSDSSTLSRDIIDLSMLQLRLGPIPDQAWVMAEEAYGAPVREAYDASVARIRERAWLENCQVKMMMHADLVDEILALHGGALPPTPSPLDD